MTQFHRWPDYQDYLGAIQAPEVCFADPLLKTANIRTDADGIPLAATGKSAIVFHADVGSQNVALRCFSRRAPGQRSRYQELHEHLTQSPPSYFVNFAYRDREILVSGDRYPVVQMGWVEGEPLDKWVEANLGRSGDLAALGASWLDIVQDMQSRNIAHGDLANDNCLVNGSDLTLIDYDDCFIPKLAGANPGEAGNPHFQHPQRIGYYALNIDAFPSLVIYLSLLALSHNSSLWRRFHRYENLIFAAADYLAPQQTPIWKELAKVSDPQITTLTAALADMCNKPISALPPLSDLVGQASTLDDQQVPWWSSWRAQAERSSSVREAQDTEPWSATLPADNRSGTQLPAKPARPLAGGTSRWKDQLHAAPPQAPRPPARHTSPAPTAGTTQPAQSAASPGPPSSANRPAPAPVRPLMPTRSIWRKRLVLNLIWLIFGGFWLAILYVLAGLVAFVLIITIPFGIAAFRIASYVLWPFGRTIEPRRDAGIGSLIGNIIWIILFGWWLALGHLVSGIALCLTIIGIPLGLADFKVIPITLMPLGVRIVPTDQRSFGTAWGPRASGPGGPAVPSDGGSAT